MKTIDGFIAKLDKLGLDNSVSAKKLCSPDGWEVTYRIELHHSNEVSTELSVQPVISVRKDDHHVLTWGCSSHMDVKKFVDWFVKKQAECQRLSFKSEDDRQEKAKQIFNEL